MFGSRTITHHLVRGLIGAGAATWALFESEVHPWLALLAIPVALLAFRGCPMCWTLGLVETVVAKIRGKPIEGLSRESCEVVK
jgi:hypothetical protein